MNEAIIKAAEEISKGLAKESPLRFTEKSKTNEGAAVRLDAFQSVLDDLDTLEEYHAALNIALGWFSRNNPAKLKSSMRIFGHVGGSVENAAAIQEDILRRYEAWWSYTTINRMIDRRDICISILGMGDSFVVSGNRQGVSDKTAKKYCIEGIKTFVDVNKTKSSGARSLGPKEIELFTVTKIINFIE